jgi:hypothetical protein
MSTLNVANITDGTDTVETGYVVNGSAKAWLRSDYSSGTPTIPNSLNISSILDVGTGVRGINLTNSMAGSDEYAVSGSADTSARANFTTTDFTAAYFNARTYYVTSPLEFADQGCHLSVHGDLA